MHTSALLAPEQSIGDIAREGVPNVDDLLVVVAQTAGTQACDGLRTLVAIQRRQVGVTQWSASNRQPVDDGLLLVGQLAQAIGDQLLQGRRQPVERILLALDPHEFVRVAHAFSDFEQAALEQRIYHLQQKERVTRRARQQIGAYLRHTRPDAQAGLQESDLVVRAQPLDLDADESAHVGVDALFGSRHQDREQR